MRDVAQSNFRVENADEGGGRVVKLFGVIDEHADLSFLAGLHGPVRISLKGVRRINSFGVRSWIDAIRKVPADCAMEFIECPPPIIDQMNMVAGFAGKGYVGSFYAPMTCERCDVEEDQLFNVADCRRLGRKLPPVPCPSCGTPMEVDDIEEQYLLFLRDQ